MILQQEKQPSEFIRDYNFLTIVDTDLSDLRVCVEALWNETSQNTQKKGKCTMLFIYCIQKHYAYLKIICDYLSLFDHFTLMLCLHH